MARIRRTAVQTLEFKIEKAEERVSKTRAAHEKAIDDLKKLYDVRKGYQKDLIMKALETSARSLDEILSFINTTIEDAKGCEDWGGSLSGYTLGDFFQEVHKIFSVFSGCIKINLFSYASLLPEFLTIVSSPFLQ